MAGERLKRTAVPIGDDDDDLSDVEDPTTFSDSVQGKFRGRVEAYGNAAQAQFPTQPLYQVGEVVFLRLHGQSQVQGPFVVSRSEGQGKYRLKRQDNSQDYPASVAEDELVVPAN